MESSDGSDTRLRPFSNRLPSTFSLSDSVSEGPKSLQGSSYLVLMGSVDDPVVVREITEKKEKTSREDSGGETKDSSRGSF